MDEDKLRIAKIGEVMTSKDGRPWIQVWFSPAHQLPDDELEVVQDRSRNFFARGPGEPPERNGQTNTRGGDKLYHSIMDAIENGKKVEGMKVRGKIVTKEIVPEFAESEFGKFTNPENGNSANVIKHATVVVLGDEPVSAAFRRQNHVIVGDDTPTGKTQAEAPNILDEGVAESVKPTRPRVEAPHQDEIMERERKGEREGEQKAPET